MRKVPFVQYLLLGLFSLALVAVFAAAVPASAQDRGTLQGEPGLIIVDDPNPRSTIVVSDAPVAITGTVNFDPARMQYWKFEIRSIYSTGFIGSDPIERVLAFDWITVGDVHTTGITDGVLGVLPTWPTLTRGPWWYRIVIVAPDNTFISEQTGRFDIQIPDDLPSVRTYIQVPANGQVLTEDTDIWGTIEMNQFVSSYRYELLGGDYTEWTVIDGPYTNDVANPTVIYDGQIGDLPPLSSLAPGRYQLRLVVLGLDSNYMQEPTVVDFAVMTDEVSTLPGLTITEPEIRSSGISIGSGMPMIGSVTVPEGGYFKVEIKDNFNPRYANGQVARFTEWTTLGEIVTSDVENGQLVYLPGQPELGGTYTLRLTVVNAEGEFVGDPMEIDLRVSMSSERDFTNTVVQQAAGGTPDAPAVITSPRLTVREDGRVSIPSIYDGTDIPIMGSITLPEGAEFWKVEIRGEEFEDWTTLGQTRTDTVVDGELAFLPGPPALEEGEYRLRLVSVGSDGNFAGTPFETIFIVR